MAKTSAATAHGSATPRGSGAGQGSEVQVAGQQARQVGDEADLTPAGQVSRSSSSPEDPKLGYVYSLEYARGFSGGTDRTDQSSRYIYCIIDL